MGVLDKVKPLSEVPAFHKLLLYGPPGVGKTTWVADAPKPLWVDFEKSTETLRHTGKDVPILVPTSINDIRDLTAAVVASEYETVVFDSISQMQDFHLDEHMRTKFKDKQRSDERYLPLFREFRISTEVMKDCFRQLQKADINVVLIAHDRVHTETRESASGEKVDRPVAIRPDMTPRVNDAVSRLLNACFYLEKETSMRGATMRKMHVNSSGLILAKNRLGIQENFLENPSWKDIFK